MTTPASAFCVLSGTFSYIYPSIFASPFCPASRHMRQGFAASKSLSTVKSPLYVACLRQKAFPKWSFGLFTIGAVYFIFFLFLSKSFAVALSGITIGFTKASLP